MWTLHCQVSHSPVTILTEVSQQRVLKLFIIGAQHSFPNLVKGSRSSYFHVTFLPLISAFIIWFTTSLGRYWSSFLVRTLRYLSFMDCQERPIKQKSQRYNIRQLNFMRQFKCTGCYNDSRANALNLAQKLFHFLTVFPKRHPSVIVEFGSRGL